MAAHRLHLALARAGRDTTFYHATGSSIDPATKAVLANRSFFWRNIAALAVSWRSRRTVPHGFVTSPRWIRKTPIEAFGPVPSVVHLHWVARWLDLPSFLRSLPPAVPLVWSLHDFIPVTGGCHYPGECDHYERHCGSCPQLKRPHPRDETFRFFGTKQSCYETRDIHLVGNTEWTTAQARRSGLMAKVRSIQTIAYGLDVELYHPVDKKAARCALGIDDDRFLIGFGSVDVSEPRKGAAELGQALLSFQRKKVTLATIGSGNWTIKPEGVELVQLGSVNSAILQRIFYSALDVFIMPSRAETFGNTALEAMACGTPVIAYAAGGLAEVVVDGVTGLVEREIGSVVGLLRMLEWMWHHPQERAAMGTAGRQHVVDRFPDALMAERYAALYDHLLQSRARSTSAATPPTSVLK